MYEELEKGEEPSKIIAKHRSNIRDDEEINKLREDISDEIKDFVDDSVSTFKKTGKSLREFSSKYYDKTRKGLENNQQHLQRNIPVAAKKLRHEITKNGKLVQDNLKNNTNQDKRHITGFIERIYGASTLGKQYGMQSIRLLREISELRQANLITASEFEEKKREILRRI